MGVVNKAETSVPVSLCVVNRSLKFKDRARFFLEMQGLCGLKACFVSVLAPKVFKTTSIFTSKNHHQSFYSKRTL